MDRLNLAWPVALCLVTLVACERAVDWRSPDAIPASIKVGAYRSGDIHRDGGGQTAFIVYDLDPEFEKNIEDTGLSAISKDLRSRSDVFSIRYKFWGETPLINDYESDQDYHNNELVLALTELQCRSAIKYKWKYKSDVCLSLRYSGSYYAYSNVGDLVVVNPRDHFVAYISSKD